MNGVFSPLVPPYVIADWRAALAAGEPRALELAYALSLTLPASADGQELVGAATAPAPEPSEYVCDVLDEAHAKYHALKTGNVRQVDIGNPAVLAFERDGDGEQILLMNNLARVSQPVNLRAYVGKEGWDILNRVEFRFPARARLEAYEFLWLLVY